MKYNMTAKVFNLVFSKYLTSYYKKNYPNIYIKDILKDIQAEYKAMVKRTPDIGGNRLESNLIGSCWFFSLAKLMPNMTPTLLNTISDSFLISPLHMKMEKSGRRKGKLFSKKEMDAWEQDSIRSQTSPYEFDWKYTFKRGEDEFFYNYTKCGVCLLAKKEGMEEYLPCMCHMDYKKFESKGGKLYREHTLADGSDHCDFHVVRIKED